MLPLGQELSHGIVTIRSEAYEVHSSADAHTVDLKVLTNSYFSIASFSTISSLLTLFSKFFSSFLHSTCLLSVSHQYLALGEVYLPFWAAVPNNPTLCCHSYIKKYTMHGVFTLYDSPFQDLMRLPDFWIALEITIRECYHSRFSVWAYASSLAATRAIFVNFFSSAYWYA